MDFGFFVDMFYSPACVVSVEKDKDEGCGDIKIVAGNKKYADMIKLRKKAEDFGDEAEALRVRFGCHYSEHFPENRSFEDACYEAAVGHKEVHTYVYLSGADMWFDIYIIPIDYQDGDVFYCYYIIKPSENADMIFENSGTSQVSNDVLKTCVKLHESDNIQDTMKSVIAEIRQICGAECCSVLLINDEAADYSIVAADFEPGSKLKRVTQFSGFYDIASSWKNMLGDEKDCIIIRNQADMDYISEINNPWYLTLVEAGVKSVVLFPLRQGIEVLGFIWASNFDTEKTMRIKETLELTTFFISSHIAKYNTLERLKYMSYTDVLTGLHNRFECGEYVSDLISQGERFTVVSINLNNFKSINDSLGFDAGNTVLFELANRWKSVSNEFNMNNHLARINGDEFMLIIKDAETDDDIRKNIDRYVDALNESLTVDGFDVYVTASFGYAEYPTDADKSDSLLSYASAAMREIKRAASGDHVLRFTQDILKNEHLLKLEKQIRQALENDTIYFNLQPQYDMDHKLRGFEALARMKDGEGNFVSPGEFIPVAEKVGLIDKVDEVVFKKATSFFGQLLQKTCEDLTLSINVSVRHLMKNDFVEEIRKLVDISGVPAEKLEIEITESIMIDSFDKALQHINEIREMGIQIAIDDFGTGYSSLSYLNKIPANLLKIDKSFIDKMNANDSSRQYVAAIISIGHIMGFDVISEGVEEDSQLDTLRSIGCDYVQGFVWGRPLSVDEAENLVFNR